MNGYLADPKRRLVELFGGESAMGVRKSTAVARVSGASSNATGAQRYSGKWLAG